MGSSSLIDIVGSMFVGVFLLLSALRMNDNAYRNNFTSQENLTVQQNLTALIRYLEADFGRMGYRRGGNPPPDSCVLFGRSDSVAFIGDMGDDGSMDTVIWYITDTIPRASPLRQRWNCWNPSVKFLIRIDRNPGHLPYPITIDTLVFGVTQFSLAYFNAFKQPIYTNHSSPYVFPTSYPPPILMQLSLMVQPNVAYDTAYSQNFAFWTETRLVSRNLTAR